MADAASGAAEAGTTDTVLAFLTTSCAECQPFWEMMAGSAAIDDLGAQLVVVTPSRSMENERLARRLVPEGVYLHMGSETWFEYGIGRAASFALVRSPRGGPAPWEEAVSYTHLDVYKRQGSGSTLASATEVMKLVSPTQRGSTCMWKWPGTPAPPALPRLAPRLAPSGL